MALLSCANVVRPNGGERDSAGPKIVRIDPPPGTLNYKGQVVDFYFDEFLKPGSYRKEIFVSPVPRFDPLVTVKNKRLRVEFKTELRDSTTYVLTLGTGIKDFNEGNGMDQSFTYAFSTGDQLDSLSMTGRVVNAWSTKPQGEMKVIVYPAEEIEGNDIFDIRPVYATETDKEGRFKVEYLKEGAYKVYAVEDKDQSYSYNNELEMIGIMENPVVDLRDTLERKRQLEMYAFVQDLAAPSVKSLKWANANTLHLKTSEAIRLAFKTDSLQISLSDTLGQGEVPLKIFRFGKDSKSDIYIHSPVANKKSFDVSFRFLMDTLGQYADTTVRIDPQMVSREDKDQLFEVPEIQLDKDRILVQSYFNLPSSLDTSQVILKDTSGNVIELDAENYGFEMRLLLAQIPPSDSVYELLIKAAIPRPEDLSQDTLLNFPLKFPNLDEYGNLQGKIVPDSADPDQPWITLIYGNATTVAAPPPPSAEADDDDGGGGRGGRGGRGSSRSSAKGGGEKELQRISGDFYQLRRYAPGKYTVKFIEDDDDNGYFTPGRLDPYEMPERVFIDPVQLEIRAKWDVEGFNVFPGAVRQAAQGDSTTTANRSQRER